MTNMEPYSALIGRWRSTGTVYDEQGREQMTMAGTDAYEWLPGGGWVAHTIDVVMGEEPTRGLELQGGWDEAAGTWTWRAFDSSGAYDEYVVRPDGASFVTIHRDGAARVRLTPAADGRTMDALWERREGDGWRRWITIHFDRES